MRSSGRYLAAFLLAISLSARPGAQDADAVGPVPMVKSAAGTRYEVLLAQESRVSMSAAASADDFRVVINRYWSFVRRYPTNGYADNAAWQAATLSVETYRRFGEDRDKHRAVQLFQWLSDQYPHSPLRVPASEQAALLEALPTETAAAGAAATAALASTSASIRAVTREVLPEVVRVTIELDREVPYYQERLDGPARLFFDLKSTRAVPPLVDATFRYESDVVRHIRLGRHPQSTTRVVLDLENVASYSVFTLYSPYRIIIDAERARVASAVAHAPSAPLAPGALHALNAPVTPNAPDAPNATSAAPNAPSAPNAPGSAPGAAPAAPVRNSSGSFSVARQLGLGVSRIVIDAGHGGHDPGASAFGLSEAELVLDVALRIETLLQQQPGIDVVLTRRTNDFLSLEERTEVANRESADLFLSIHANASATATARGVETYFLNFALNPQAEAVAARENAASGKTMNSLPGIIKAITLNSKLNESRDFATSIQRALVRGLRPGNRNLKDLGVKQAPFVVLIGAAMPSVLAEISFVTNRQEARLLKTPAYRQRIAESLLTGILRYQQALKKIQTTAQR
jgi:N-acetylmuramoyl-L-alanine amidase